MQAKKFEAPSIKEALHLVKTSLGPEAIVLGFQEKRIWGEKKGVEITAVVSEGDFKKKKFAESKLREEDKEKFQKSSARNQKEFIEKTLQRLKSESLFKEITSAPYISISDEDRDLNRNSKENLSSSPSSLQTSSKEKPAKNKLSSAENTSSVYTLNKPPFVMNRKWISSKYPSSYLSNKNPSSQKSGMSSFERKSKPDWSSSIREKERVPVPPSSLRKKEESFHLKNLFDKFKKKTHSFIESDFIKTKLLKKGFSAKNVRSIISLLEKSLDEQSLKDKDLILAFVVKYFLDKIEVCSGLQTESFHFFVGSPGSGKTSSLIKTAMHMLKEEKRRVALVNTNQMKIGISQEFKIFSEILHVPFFQIDQTHSVHKIKQELEELREEDVDCFLIDGPSLGKRFQRDEGPSFLDEEIRIHYVQSLLHDERTAFDIVSQSHLPFQDVIFTHLDQSSRYGMIYNFQKEFQSPLHSFGLGESLTEDFEWATKERFLDLIFDFCGSKETEKDKKEKTQQ